MNCIKCERHLENFVEHENHPVDATEFYTYGHYGSRVTDKMDGTKHIINLCDDCCEKALASGLCKRI